MSDHLSSMGARFLGRSWRCSRAGRALRPPKAICRRFRPGSKHRLLATGLPARSNASVLEAGGNRRRGRVADRDAIQVVTSAAPISRCWSRTAGGQFPRDRPASPGPHLSCFGGRGDRRRDDASRATRRQQRPSPPGAGLAPAGRGRGAAHWPRTDAKRRGPRPVGGGGMGDRFGPPIWLCCCDARCVTGTRLCAASVTTLLGVGAMGAPTGLARRMRHDGRRFCLYRHRGREAGGGTRRHIASHLCAAVEDRGTLPAPMPVCGRRRNNPACRMLASTTDGGDRGRGGKGRPRSITQPPGAVGQRWNLPPVPASTPSRGRRYGLPRRAPGLQQDARTVQWYWTADARAACRR